MNIQEFKNYSMKGKTFTIVDIQNKKKTIRIGNEETSPTMEVIETEDTNLCSCWINIEFPRYEEDPEFEMDKEDEENEKIKVRIYEIVEIIESPVADIIIVYNQDCWWEKLAAGRLQHWYYGIIRGAYYFIPDTELKQLLKEIEDWNKQ